MRKATLEQRILDLLLDVVMDNPPDETVWIDANAIAYVVTNSKTHRERKQVLETLRKLERRGEVMSWRFDEGLGWRLFTDED